MTRYTKLERKRHVEASESFSVTPLVPTKKAQSTDSAKTKTREASTEPSTTTKEKKQGKKRKAEDASESTGHVQSGDAQGEDTPKPSKKAKAGQEKKNKNKNKKDKKSTPTEQGKQTATQIVQELNAFLLTIGQWQKRWILTTKFLKWFLIVDLGD